MIWLILIICGLAIDSMGDNKKKRQYKRRSSNNSWYNENSWLDAAWFHDHGQKMWNPFRIRVSMLLSTYKKGVLPQTGIGRPRWLIPVCGLYVILYNIHPTTRHLWQPSIGFFLTDCSVFEYVLAQNIGNILFMLFPLEDFSCEVSSWKWLDNIYRGFLLWRIDSITLTGFIQ